MTLKLGKWDREHVGRVVASGDWWTAQFWRLYQTSDQEHRAALRLAAPEHAEAFEAWEKDTGRVR